MVGALVSEFGYTDAFAMLSAIGITVAILSPLYPRNLEQAAEEETEEQDTGLQAAFDQQLQDAEGEPYRFGNQAIKDQ